MDLYKYIFTPSQTVLTLTEVKEHLQLGTLYVNEDSYLTMLIKSITQYFEKYTGIEILTKRCLTYRNKFCNYFVLEKSEFIKLNSIKYLSNNAEVLLDVSNYEVYKQPFFSHIIFKNIVNTDDVLQNIKVDFYAGMGIEVSSIERSSDVVEVITINNHGYDTGDTVIITGALDASFNGNYLITKVDDTTFTYDNEGADGSTTGDVFSHKIPNDLKLALLHHIANVYSNRGKCQAGNKQACYVSSAMNTGTSKAIYDNYWIPRV